MTQEEIDKIHAGFDKLMLKSFIEKAHHDFLFEEFPKMLAEIKRLNGEIADLSEANRKLDRVCRHYHDLLQITGKS